MPRPTAKRYKVSVTANFESNLEIIEKFLADAGAPTAFAALLESLSEKVVPTLDHYPNAGRSFLDLAVQSVEAQQRISRINAMLGATSLREYIVGDYLMLYAVQEKAVYLLSIRHHRQLSFDITSVRVLTE